MPHDKKTQIKTQGKEPISKKEWKKSHSCPNMLSQEGGWRSFVILWVFRLVVVPVSTHIQIYSSSDILIHVSICWCTVPRASQMQTWHLLSHTCAPTSEQVLGVNTTCGLFQKRLPFLCDVIRHTHCIIWGLTLFKQLLDLRVYIVLTSPQ